MLPVRSQMFFSEQEAELAKIVEAFYNNPQDFLKALKKERDLNNQYILELEKTLYTLTKMFELVIEKYPEIDKIKGRQVLEVFNETKEFINVNFQWQNDFSDLT